MSTCVELIPTWKTMQGIWEMDYYIQCSSKELKNDYNLLLMNVICVLEYNVYFFCIPDLCQYANEGLDKESAGLHCVTKKQNTVK